MLCSGSLDAHEQTPTVAKRRWCACPLQPILLRRTSDSVNELSGPTTRCAIYPAESRPLGTSLPDWQDARRRMDGLAELALRHQASTRRSGCRAAAFLQDAPSPWALLRNRT
ncbi:hypothetical protein BRN03_24200 [Xanthomonas oryzae pv. oryzae]|nr:hypothetical protein BRM77_13125 [Xanthomonas oryzae pv. oryzae]AXM29119.1 hypothetical protein BRM78_14360 [Xanthomonas oryzae pv. oryzae]AXM35829.1 hypothetical protein BRM84_08935 [Xanthomonas oryzae pv. oryzae]QBN87558.1 hypothetical protein EBA17_15530 [Xanthomonas oryzae pv. oryzae]QBN94376.1 hypothetical protein EBA19_09490 [Xanthomonas oryzae pv. oryzae]